MRHQHDCGHQDRCLEPAHAQCTYCALKALIEGQTAKRRELAARGAIPPELAELLIEQRAERASLTRKRDGL